MAIRTPRTFILAGLFGMSLSAIAAAVPPVLDWVPPDAPVVIAVPNLSQAEGNFKALIDATALPLPPMTLEGLLDATGMAGSVDTAKPVAIFFPTLKDGEIPDDGEIALIPVTDFKKFVEAQGGEAGDGVIQIHPGGGDGFARDLGNGYVAMGHSREVIEGFAPKAGGIDAFTKAIGKAGNTIADSSDLFAIVDLQRLKPMLESGVAEIKKEMASGMEMMGQDASAAQNSMAMMTSAIDAFLRDGRSVVAGTSMNAGGFGINMSMTFADGSEMSKAFAPGSDSSSLLKNLPTQPYLFATAMDLSNAVIRGWMKTAAEAQAKAQPGMPNMLTNAINGVDGQAMSFGLNPMAMMGGGLFTNTVVYMRSANPAVCLDELKKNMTAMSGFSAQGMTINTSLKEAETTVAGQTVDGYEMKLEMDDTNPMAGQAMAMIFGPAGGPAGYLAKTETGVIQTMGKNSVLLQQTLEATTKDNMSKDALLAKVAERLPANRIMEAYLGAKSILDMAMPLMAMAGASVNVEVPASMPPIGMGIGGLEGAAHIGFFVPAEVIKTGGELGMALQGMAGGMAPRGGDGGEAPDEKPAGQPRF